MKNSINYYYGIYVNDIIKNAEEYYFYYNNHEYHLVQLNRPYEDIKSLYELNLEMIRRNILVHKIIKNLNNEIVTVINEKMYLLLELCDYKNEKVLINDIKYYQNFTINIKYKKDLLRNNWINMWCDKIDYYEYQISELGNKYTILCDSLSYYIGLGENAISYLKNNITNENIDYVVSHKRIRIEDGSFEFYNPINFIIDNRVRDIAEYIKNSFFYEKIDLYEIKLYLDNINFKRIEYILLFSRLLFPSYYFDVYDEIINNNLEEEKIIRIIEKNQSYEELLIEIYNYITKEKNIFIEPIDWLYNRYL